MADKDKKPKATKPLPLRSKALEYRGDVRGLTPTSRVVEYPTVPAGPVLAAGAGGENPPMVPAIPAAINPREFALPGQMPGHTSIMEYAEPGAEPPLRSLPPTTSSYEDYWLPVPEPFIPFKTGDTMPASVAGKDRLNMDPEYLDKTFLPDAYKKSGTVPPMLRTAEGGIEPVLPDAAPATRVAASTPLDEKQALIRKFLDTPVPESRYNPDILAAQDAVSKETAEPIKSPEEMQRERLLGIAADQERYGKYGFEAGGVGALQSAQEKEVFEEKVSAAKKRRLEALGIAADVAQRLGDADMVQYLAPLKGAALIEDAIPTPRTTGRQPVNGQAVIKMLPNEVLRIIANGKMSPENKALWGKVMANSATVEEAQQAMMALNADGVPMPWLSGALSALTRAATSPETNPTMAAQAAASIPGVMGNLTGGDLRAGFTPEGVARSQQEQSPAAAAREGVARLTQEEMNERQRKELESKRQLAQVDADIKYRLAEYNRGMDVYLEEVRAKNDAALKGGKPDASVAKAITDLDERLRDLQEKKRQTADLAEAYQQALEASNMFRRHRDQIATKGGGFADPQELRNYITSIMGGVTPVGGKPLSPAAAAMLQAPEAMMGMDISLKLRNLSPAELQSITDANFYRINGGAIAQKIAVERARLLQSQTEKGLVPPVTVGPKPELGTPPKPRKSGSTLPGLRPATPKMDVRPKPTQKASSPPPKPAAKSSIGAAVKRGEDKVNGGALGKL